MKKTIFSLGLTLFSLSLCAMPYYSERRQGTVMYIFKGTIAEENEPYARKLENQYMEYASNRAHYQAEFQALGIEVTTLNSQGGRRSGLPPEIRNPELPEGVKG